MTEDHLMTIPHPAIPDGEGREEELSLSRGSPTARSEHSLPSVGRSEAQSQAGWRDIASAPKDGAPFWGFLFETGIRLLRWATPQECAAYEGSDELDGYDGCFVELADFGEDWSPKWWLPLDALPIPPSATVKGLADYLSERSSSPSEASACGTTSDQNPNEWREWSGGICPVTDDAGVDLRFDEPVERDDPRLEFFGQRAGDWVWNNNDACPPIKWWRPHQYREDQRPNSEPPAKNGADVRSPEGASASLATAELNPPPTGEGWRPIETAPKDGTDIIAWCVHANAEFSKDPVGEGWAAPVIARWIDHNGGGWTWHGLCGVHTHWISLPPAKER